MSAWSLWARYACDRIHAGGAGTAKRILFTRRTGLTRVTSLAGRTICARSARVAVRAGASEEDDGKQYRDLTRHEAMLAQFNM